MGPGLQTIGKSGLGGTGDKLREEGVMANNRESDLHPTINSDKQLVSQLLVFNYEGSERDSVVITALQINLVSNVIDLIARV